MLFLNKHLLVVISIAKPLQYIYSLTYLNLSLSLYIYIYMYVYVYMKYCEKFCISDTTADTFTTIYWLSA